MAGGSAASLANCVCCVLKFYLILRYQYQPITTMVSIPSVVGKPMVFHINCGFVMTTVPAFLSIPTNKATKDHKKRKTWY